MRLEPATLEEGDPRRYVGTFHLYQHHFFGFLGTVRLTSTSPRIDWDQGYEHTAYFLDFLEQRFGEGTVRRLNDKLRHKYTETTFWVELVGHPVEKLYGDYVEKSKDKDDGDL